MDGWFPKINERGEVVSGSGSVWFRKNYKNTDGIQIGLGWTPAFLDNSWIMYSNGVNVAVYDILNNRTIQRYNESYSDIVASKGKYIGWLSGQLHHDGIVRDAKSVLSISKSGKFTAWLEPWQTNDSVIVINKKVLIVDGDEYRTTIYQVSIGDQAVAWTIEAGGKRETYGITNHTFCGLTVRSWEEVQICDTPNGPWIISKFQDGLGARPFLSHYGQFFPGVFDNPDSIWFNDKIIVVSSERGIPKYLEIDPSILNVDLSKLDDVSIPPNPNPEPPDPNPEPEPEPPAQMKIPHIGDNEIIELAQIYESFHAKRHEEAYMRDGCYYGLGYIRNRTTQSHEQAKENYKKAAKDLAYYNPKPNGMFSDEEIIEISHVFINRYTMVGKYQHQNKEENNRDQTYYAVSYASSRESFKSHVDALHDMENHIAIDAGFEPPYKPEIAKPLVLVPDRQILRDSEDKPFSVQCVTAFKLLNLFEHNKHSEFISIYNNYNAFRIFPYVPVKDWKDDAWDAPSNYIVSNFILEMLERGKYVKLTLLTDDDPNRVPWAIELINYLKEFEFSNLILEAGNEPLTHKNINVDALHQSLRDSGYLFTSGIYEDTRKFYGKIGNDHSARDEEWVRKVHNLLECYNGGGPNFPDEPATKVPWCEDEPIKPHEALKYGGPESVLRDYYTYAALCTQFGFGGTFHCESAKFCTIPDTFEMDCADVFLVGLNVYPSDTALGDYERIVEGDPNKPVETHNSLRTYRVGNTLTRVRPKTIQLPGPEWNPLDNWGICFRK